MDEVIFHLLALISGALLSAFPIWVFFQLGCAYTKGKPEWDADFHREKELNERITAKDSALGAITEFLLMEIMFDDEKTVAELDARRAEMFRKGRSAFEIGQPMKPAQAKPKVECYEGTDVPIAPFAPNEAALRAGRNSDVPLPAEHAAVTSG
jgi:hypothetical protein